MRYRKLGRLETKVSEIGVGCSGFWGHRRFPEEDAHNIIYKAVEEGVNFFDTGHNYCNYNAEPRLGRALKKVFKKRDRKSFVVSTKAGTTIGNAKIIYKKGSESNYNPEYIKSCILKSISNLNCHYLDIFQLHGLPSEEFLNEGLLDTLLDLKSDGIIKSLGVNTHNLEDMEYILENSSNFDLVLLDYNVLQLDREDIIEKLANAGVGVLAGTVLAQGSLVKGKIGSIKSMADLWYLARALIKPASRALLRKSKPMRKTLAEIENMNSAQAAVSYVLNNKNISSCIFGTTKRKNLIEIIESTEKEITAEGLSRIINTYKHYGL